MFYGDGSVVTEANLTSWKPAIIYPQIGKSLIRTLLLCPPVTGTDPGGYTCIWAVLFRKPQITQIEEYWSCECEIMWDDSDL